MTLGLLVEAGAVGVLVVVFVALVAFLYGKMYTSLDVTKMGISQNVAIALLFLGGAAMHIGLEFAGLNKYYIENGVAGAEYDV